MAKHRNPEVRPAGAELSRKPRSPSSLGIELGTHGHLLFLWAGAGKIRIKYVKTTVNASLDGQGHSEDLFQFSSLSQTQCLCPSDTHALKP